jgi:hypothetical protein
MMFGRYVGQISARVQRAWLRPRTPMGASSFACRVQILQDRVGNVQEVTLQQCNGDLHWQASLVQAIQSASPLPAPPDPAVFSNLLTMEFDSDQYRAGGHAEGFEPELNLAATDAVAVSPPPVSSGSGLNDPPNDPDAGDPAASVNQ